MSMSNKHTRNLNSRPPDFNCQVIGTKQESEHQIFGMAIMPFLCKGTLLFVAFYLGFCQ